VCLHDGFMSVSIRLHVSRSQPAAGTTELILNHVVGTQEKPRLLRDEDRGRLQKRASIRGAKTLTLLCCVQESDASCEEIRSSVSPPGPFLTGGERSPGLFTSTAFVLLRGQSL